MQLELSFRCPGRVRRPGWRRPAGHRSLRSSRPARRTYAGRPGRRPQQGSVLHACRGSRPRFWPVPGFHSASRPSQRLASRPGPRASRRPAGPRARRCASSAGEITARSWSATAAPDPPATSSQGRRVIGHHDGIHRFTPGQRRGVGVAANTPIYVIRTEPRSGPGGGRAAGGTRAHLGERQSRRGVRRRRARPGQAAVPLRARVGDGAPTYRRDSARARRPGRSGVAAGQTAVLYQDGIVVGAGTIA